MTRQALKQQEHRRRGLCTLCSKPATRGQHCEKHYLSQREARASYEARQLRAELEELERRGQLSFPFATEPPFHSHSAPTSSSVAGAAGASASSGTTFARSSTGGLDAGVGVQLTPAGREALARIGKRKRSGKPKSKAKRKPAAKASRKRGAR